ncbi:hypothetical protein [Vannielia litorea]|uniref:hypothetical protein n=1 Tax=Vannielia litorea TaxID=1217970 RepID=UPI001BCE7D67|nr:hypothetical protein [Vannielia litorea]MBS8229162.1 hypothetical protein [Vannielia litorea]
MIGRILDGMIIWAVPPISLVLAFLEASLFSKWLSGAGSLIAIILLFVANVLGLGFLWSKFIRKRG